jgi:hypothetical protein
VAKASAVIKQSPEVISRAGPFGVVILAPRDLEPRLLEGSARLVWDLLSDWSTSEAVSLSLAELFGADHEVISHDVEMVINELIATEAVVVS